MVPEAEDGPTARNGKNLQAFRASDGSGEDEKTWRDSDQNRAGEIVVLLAGPAKGARSSVLGGGTTEDELDARAAARRRNSRAGYDSIAAKLGTYREAESKIEDTDDLGKFDVELEW